MKGLGWKSITGAIVGAVGFLARPEVFAILPGEVSAVVTAAGAVLSVFGLRHAQSKAEAAARAAELEARRLGIEFDDPAERGP